MLHFIYAPCLFNFIKMYSQGLDLAKLLDSAAKYEIVNDRSQFVAPLQAIEKFAVGRKMIIGGAALIRAEHPLEAVSAEMWRLELYSASIEIDMRECATSLYEEMSKHELYGGDARTIILRASIPDREYQLWIDYRIVAIGRSLGERKGIDVVGIINKTEGVAPFGTTGALLMSDEMQIMRILHSSCDPGQAGQWVRNITQLEILMNKKSGARKHRAKDAVSSDGDEHEEERSESVSIPLKGVLIGEIAASFYLGVACKKDCVQRPQYLCSFDDVDDIASESGFTMSQEDLRIPDDFRLRKRVLKKTQGGAFIADLFNTLSYEPVPIGGTLSKEGSRKLPFGENGRDIASPICVLRFLYVEMWALKFMVEMNRSRGNDATPLERRKGFLDVLAHRLFSFIEEKCSVDIMFPAHLEGYFVPEMVAKRKIVAKSDYVGPFSPVKKEELAALSSEIVATVSFA